MNFSHESIEKNPWLLIVLVTLVISIGGAVEIIPLFFQRSTTEPVAGLKPYSAAAPGGPRHLRAGRLLQLPLADDPPVPRRDRALRPLLGGRRVRLRPGPFQWGSKRTGPDLARVGGRYSDEWHRAHLDNPRDLVPESNMPGYPWLAKTRLDPQEVIPKMRALRRLSVPYTDEEIAAAPESLAGKTEQDALVAYLQGLGIHIKARN